MDPGQPGDLARRRPGLWLLAASRRAGLLAYGDPAAGARTGIGTGRDPGGSVATLPEAGRLSASGAGRGGDRLQPTLPCATDLTLRRRPRPVPQTSPCAVDLARAAEFAEPIGSAIAPNLPFGIPPAPRRDAAGRRLPGA